ncbi:hypothetical protein BJX63DRAFT_441951 [Aspergillus granulosus]|uniref:Uncharacterized protein n=1 Tax=Aspergillus granulosus TaxID=176169 RepID=A0ABR4GT42_9EURO
MMPFETPVDISLSTQDFLASADVKNILNTGTLLWERIFQNTSWLEFALTFNQCSPVVIGHNLSAYRPGKSSNRLYLALIANDHSGDLKYESQRFFATLQDGWTYNTDKYEVYFPFGITLNIYDVINGHDTLKLPLEKIFTNKRQGVCSEYCYYKYPAIRELQPCDIMKWDPEYRSHPHPHARLGWWNGPASKGRDIRNGCRLTLRKLDIEITYILLPECVKGKAWATIA